MILLSAWTSLNRRNPSIWQLSIVLKANTMIQPTWWGKTTKLLALLSPSAQWRVQRDLCMPSEAAGSREHGFNFSTVALIRPGSRSCSKADGSKSRMQLNQSCWSGKTSAFPRFREHLEFSFTSSLCSACLCSASTSSPSSKPLKTLLSLNYQGFNARQVLTGTLPTLIIMQRLIKGLVTTIASARTC